MKEKIKEYIMELDKEITRCTKTIEDEFAKGNNEYDETIEYYMLLERIKTLNEVLSDLKSRIEELENMEEK
jgi:predicted RNase H-like nuclease (RuvC/YqgF family)